MPSGKHDITIFRRHIKAKRAARALAIFGLITSILLLTFESVSLGFGLTNGTVINVHAECRMAYCYIGVGLWAGFLGILASVFGLFSLRKCKISKNRYAVYFVLCSFSSLCDTVAILLSWACISNLFECLRYEQENFEIDRSLKIMVIMYACLLLEMFVHMVASNASIAFALYNCCLPDPQRCDHCAKNIIERYAQRTDMINNMELRESSVDRHLGRTATGSTDFPRANYTQSLPRYVVLSSKPTSV